MLITTSRRPSPRTRSFCRRIEKIINSHYVNRGKMSIRDMLLKSSQLGHDTIFLVGEMKGNPSIIRILNSKGENILTLQVKVSLEGHKGRIRKDNLRFKCDVDELRVLANILKIPVADSSPAADLLWIKEGEDKKAIIEFYDHHGLLTIPRIRIEKVDSRKLNS